jgi:transposase
MRRPPSPWPSCRRYWLITALRSRSVRYGGSSRGGITRKKDSARHGGGSTGHPKRREEWFDGQLDLDPEQLIFIDKTWASTNLARRDGQAPRGERLRAGVPHGHWKTFVAGLSRTSMIAPWVLDGAMNSDAFTTYVARILVPELSHDNVVIMDNLSSHKAPAVRAVIDAAGVRLLFLPPYSSDFNDFNTIEMAFSKLKADLRKVAKRTIHGLWDAIGRIVDLYTPQECSNYFSAPGYDADWSETALNSSSTKCDFVIGLLGAVTCFDRLAIATSRSPSARIQRSSTFSTATRVTHRLNIIQIEKSRLVPVGLQVNSLYCLKFSQLPPLPSVKRNSRPQLRLLNVSILSYLTTLFNRGLNH